MTVRKQDIEQLARLRTLTNQLMEAGENGKWDLFQSIAEQRQRFLERMDLQPADAKQAAQYQQIIEEIQRDDQLLAERTVQQRRAILDGLKSEDKGNKMKAAYGRAKRPF